MPTGIRASLELRMIILAATGLLAVFAAFAGLSYWSIEEGVGRTVEERQLLARMTADRLSDLLRQNLDALQDISVPWQIRGSNANLAPFRATIHEVYLRSIFRGGVYLVDARGSLLLGEPADIVAEGTAGRQKAVLQALQTGKPVIGDVYLQSSGQLLATAVLPIHDPSGEPAGAVGGDIDLRDRRIQDAIQSVAIGKTGYLQVRDSAGNVVAGRDFGLPVEQHEALAFAALVQRRQAGVATCHDCHSGSVGSLRQNQVIDFAPVPGTTWSVVARQSEDEAFGPLHRLQRIWLFAGVPLFLILLAFAWATARSVVRPLGALASAAERITGGDLATPISVIGNDEVGRLARTFETMRARLAQSIERINAWNVTLEQRVHERTEQLVEQERVRRELLRKVISVQEEERRRIARELHDETSQSLAALILAVDMTILSSAEAPSDELRRDVGAKLSSLKALAVQVLDGVHELIFDLRPSLLDDLGLAAALCWYAESRLQAAGVAVSIETSGTESRLAPEVETTLFRVLQEAITNVAKHASADHAAVRFEVGDRLVVAEVEDDGRGFDPAAVVPHSASMEGLGLLGMRERVELLGGQVAISSRCGQGTLVHVEVPIHPEGVERDEDKSAPSRRPRDSARRLEGAAEHSG